MSKAKLVCVLLMACLVAHSNSSDNGPTDTVEGRDFMRIISNSDEPLQHSEALQPTKEDHEQKSPEKVVPSSSSTSNNTDQEGNGNDEFDNLLSKVGDYAKTVRDNQRMSTILLKHIQKVISLSKILKSEAREMRRLVMHEFDL